jgi:lipopolysaccharide/colanic/teichoic acid biosynthesis glycosyltransferase
MQSVIGEATTLSRFWKEPNRKLTDDLQRGHQGYLVFKRAMDIAISLLVVLLVFPGRFRLSAC